MKKETKNLLMLLKGYYFRYSEEDFESLLYASHAEVKEIFELLFKFTYVFEPFEFDLIEHLRFQFNELKTKEVEELQVQFLSFKKKYKNYIEEYLPILENTESFIKNYINNKKN